MTNMRDQVQEQERENLEVRKVEEEAVVPNLVQVTEKEKESYHEVVDCMKSALDPAAPELHTGYGLSYDEQHAIRYLYEAKTGIDLESGGDQIDALERKHELNKALAVLAPVLAKGMSPDFEEGRDEYIEMRELIKELRKRIEDQILKENMIPKEVLRKKTKEEDETDPEDEEAIFERQMEAPEAIKKKED